MGLVRCRQGARRRRCGASSTTSDAVCTSQAPCAQRVRGGEGQLRRCFSSTMGEHRLLRSALHLTPRHQERNPVYSSDRPQLDGLFEHPVVLFVSSFQCSALSRENTSNLTETNPKFEISQSEILLSRSRTPPCPRWRRFFCTHLRIRRGCWGSGPGTRSARRRFSRLRRCLSGLRPYT